MGRRTLLLIASILVAAVGTALIFLYVRGADKRAEKGAETVRVVFAVKAIPRGESISAAGASFKLVSVPRDTLPAAGAYYADKPGFDQLMAQPTNSAVVDIPANSMIRKSDFGGAGEASSIGVAPDKVAISMQLTDPNRAAGLLKPGTIVAVIITTDPATAKELGIRQIPRADPDAKYTISTAIMNDAKVISIGSTGQSSEGNGTGETVDSKIVAVEVTPEESLSIRGGEKAGELSLAILGKDVKFPVKSPPQFLDLSKWAPA